MLELPKRETELVVEVEKGTVKLILEPLTDAQFDMLIETAEQREETNAAGEPVQVHLFRPWMIPGVFADRLRRVEGAGVDGGPIDPTNPEHLARMPQSWRGIALQRLATYATTGLVALLGNSRAPAEPSPAEGTPSTG